MNEESARALFGSLARRMLSESGLTGTSVLRLGSCTLGLARRPGQLQLVFGPPGVKPQDLCSVSGRSWEELAAELQANADAVEEHRAELEVTEEGRTFMSGSLKAIGCAMGTVAEMLRLDKGACV